MNGTQSLNMAGLLYYFQLGRFGQGEKSPKLILEPRIIGFKYQRPQSIVPPFKTIHESSGQIGLDGRVEFSRSLDSPNPRDIKKSQHRFIYLALC